VPRLGTLSTPIVRRAKRQIVVSEPAWKKLVEELRAQGHESPYLDRLRERLPKGGSLEDLQREILQEMASALGRAEDKVNVALLELEVQGKTIDAMPADVDRSKAIAAFNRKRDDAVRALWELRVHREALGFRRNDKLAELYPIPPKR